MHTQHNTRSSLFLIELIIAILFFSLGSAICVQAFVKAHTLTAQAQDLSFASSTVSSAASALKYTDGAPDQFRDFFPGAAFDGDDISVCYDGSYAACEAADAVYTLRIHTGPIDGGRSATIRMDDRDGTAIYELQLTLPDL